MRIAVALLLVTLAASGASADEVVGHRRHGDARTDLFIAVPLDYDTRVVFPFGGSHHAVPGVVSINQEPYFCRPHQLAFRDRARFVEHLSVKHGLTDREIPSMVVVDRNQVRYVGD